MAGVTDKRLVTLAGWPAGIDNLSPEQDLTRDPDGVVSAVRMAENVDLSRDGKPRRRAGRTRVLSAARVHSLWHAGAWPFALYVADDQLMAFQPGENYAVAGGLSQGWPVSYALAADKVYWSNGFQTGVVLPDGSVAPWGCKGPGGTPTLTAVPGAGALDAGTYQVAMTFQLASGEESGASLAATIDVPEGGGIALSDIPAPLDDGVARARIYVTGAQGDVLYHAMDLAPGLPAAMLGQGPRGKMLDTQFLTPMSAGSIVRWFAGRLYVAAADVLAWSQALRYGLHHPAFNRIRFGAAIDMVQPVASGGDGAGLYVAAGDRVYFLAGADPATFTQAIARSRGVVPCSALAVEASVFGVQQGGEVAYWMGRDGVPCLGLPGGQVMPLREGQVVAPQAASAASLYREQNGLRQVVTALSQSRPQGLAFSDSVTVTVQRFDG